MFLYHTPKKY